MATTGDPGAIQRRLKYFSGPAFLDDASDAIAASGLKEIQDGFNEQRDPYGKSWKPIRRRGKILQKTGRLYRSATGRRRPGGGAELGLTASYAGFQNDGTDPHARKARYQPVNKRGRFVSRLKAGTYRRKANVRYLPGGTNPGIAARPMIPDDRGLPPKWEKAFDKSIDTLVQRKAREL